MTKNGDDLSPETRAEDILLGSLGYGEEARVLSLERTKNGYRGVGKWPDGEQFTFENDDELGDLEIWALDLLTVRQRA
jgi:hypothetical protein